MVDPDNNLEVQRGFLMRMQGDDPPYLSVGTAVSAKYKGAFCEAKVSKVVRVVKCKVTYKSGLGSAVLSDEQIRGTLRVGQLVQAKHMEKKEYIDATVTKIQDCSQYTVVFDDGDITTLRRTALCLKSGRHFNESETLDQLPLTHPEHFGNPVVVGAVNKRGRRNRQPKEESSDGEIEEETEPVLEGYTLEVGRVVCVESSDKKRNKDNWFPGLVVIPSAQPTVRINAKDEFLVRSFKDGRYYTVPQTEVTEFNQDIASKVEGNLLAEAVEKATRYLDHDELPLHWERSLLFPSSMQLLSTDSDEIFTDSSDDETPEEKDHFVAQLYKFMDDSNTPLNKSPMIGSKDVDLHKLFRVVRKLGGYNRVTNKNKWRTVTIRLKFPNNVITHNQVKSVYKKFLFSFEAFHRTLGVTMLNHSQSSKKSKGRSLIRDRDRNTPVNSPKPDKEDEVQIEKEEEKKEERPKYTKKLGVRIRSEEERRRREAREISLAALSCDRFELGEPTVLMVRLTRTDANLEEIEERSRLSLERLRLSMFGEKSEEQVMDKEKAMLKEKEKIKEKEMQKEKEKEKDKPKEKEKENEVEKETVQQTRSKTQIPKIKEKDAAVKEKEAVKEVIIEKKLRDTKTPVREPSSVAKAPVREPSALPKTSVREPSAIPKTPVKIIKKPEEDKKKGKKRSVDEKEKNTVDEEDTVPVFNSSITDSPSKHPLVVVGDKLKVYYGPNHESKVTYEAKVMEIDKQSVHPMYLVHYTGWNTRYDEWITQCRIAENLSATTKAKRLKHKAMSKLKNITHRAVARRGRRISTAGRIPSQENVRLTSRSESPTTSYPARQHRITRQDSTKSTRHASVHSDASNNLSDSDSSESDSDTAKSVNFRSEDIDGAGINKVYLTAVVMLEKRETEKEESEEDEEPQSVNKPDSPGKLQKAQPNSEADERSCESDKETSGAFPKGRDFDLNQIRSELKGLVETEVDSTDTTEKDIISSGESFVSTKLQTISITSEHEAEETEKCEIPPVTESINSDDIYEFKEPEPFEFEARNKISEDKNKKRPRIFDELEKSPPKRKSESPLKDLETDTKQLQKTPIRKETDEDKLNEDANKKLALSEDPFDKLVESPSFHSGKEKIISHINVESREMVTKTLNLDGPSNVFYDLPESVRDENGEQLDVSNPKMPTEPLVSEKVHQFPDFSFSTELLDANFQDLISSNVEDKNNEESDDDDEDVALRESVQDVLNHTISSDDSNEAMLLDVPFIHLPNNEAAINTENMITSFVINLCGTESDDDTESSDEIINSIMLRSPSKEKRPEPAQILQNNPESQKKTKPKVDSLLLKLGIIQVNDSDDEDDVQEVIIPLPEPKKLDNPVVVQTGEGRIKTLEPKIRPIELHLNPIEQNTNKIKTLEPKIKTLEPKFKISETKFKSIEDTINEVVADMKKHGRKFVAQEFVDEYDSDSTDSDERLVIRSDDESHTTSSSDAKSGEPQSAHSDENFKFDIKSPSSNDKDDSSKTETDSSNKEDEPDSHLHSLLLCEETIPGSPAPATEDPITETVRPRNKSILEMTFASTSATGNKSELPKERLVIKERTQPPPLIIPLDNRDREGNDVVPTVLDNTPPTTPESTLSNLSPRGDSGDLSPNMLDESCEGEGDYSLQKQSCSRNLLSYGEEESGDTLLNLDSSFSSKRVQETAIGSSIRKRRQSYKASDEMPIKRRRKPLSNSRHDSDSDDTSDHSGSSLLPGGSSNDGQLLRTPKPSKYNFSVNLDPNLDSSTRIAILQQTLQDIRKAYAGVKAELAAVERRRKKLRRRERDAKSAAKQDAATT